MKNHAGKPFSHINLNISSFQLQDFCELNLAWIQNEISIEPNFFQIYETDLPRKWNLRVFFCKITTLVFFFSAVLTFRVNTKYICISSASLEQRQITLLCFLTQSILILMTS